MNFKFLSALTAVALIPSYAISQTNEEIKLDVDNNVNLAISVYNDNLALVKDTRRVSLPVGKTSVAFVGVAKQMKPDTAIVSFSSNGVSVLEQNYDYNIINPNSILKESVGKKVKTAITDIQTGKTTFSEALVLESEYGAVLQFDYGIETNFPGRVIFDKLPDNLRTKPTFVISLDNKISQNQDVELSYLTSGMTWKADYVANIKDDKKMSLESFVTLTNNSGVDYKNASIQFISGTINQVYTVSPVVPMARSAVMKQNMVMDMEAAESVSSYAGGLGMGGNYANQGTVGEYHIYTIPSNTTIKNQQTKQIKLFESDNVSFSKEYRFTSPLNISSYSSNGEFTKANPLTIYKITNDKDSNIGMPLPKGVIRFYNKDDADKTQFIGESDIKQLAVNEEGELNLGIASDIFAKGKIVNITTIAKNIKEVDVEVTIINSKDEDVSVKFEQNIYDEWKVLSETHTSEKKSQSVARWTVDVPSKGNVDLKFKIRVSREQ